MASTGDSKTTEILRIFREELNNKRLQKCNMTFKKEILMKHFRYGLIIPGKNNKLVPQAPVARPSIFGDDSDSDTPQPVKPTGLPNQTKQRKQDVSSQNKAIEEDPTVFQYDEIYDEMEQKRKESKLARKDLDRKPKYITKLLVAADRRKRENERRIERQVQKEREEEGDQFRDKEAFVTSSYKKKLEELKILEEQERREDYLESIGDVRKQGNLDGFYRHLYDQKVNYEDEIKKEKEVEEEPQDNNLEEDKNSLEKEEAITKSRKRSSSHNSESGTDDRRKIMKKDIQKRKYRSRKDSENSDNNDANVEIKKEHLPSNLDADSDFSIDSSDSEDEKTEEKNNKNTTKEKTENIPEKANVLSDNAALAKVNETKDTNSDKTGKDTKEKVQEVKEEKPKKPKVDIWKKRTVGVVFDEAVKRYFERKAIREAASSG